MMRRTLGGLEPEDEHTLSQLRAVQVGETVEVELKMPRDYRKLKKWWALCRMLAYHAGQFPSPRAAHGFLKIRTGHAIQIVNKATGDIYEIPDSIAFDSIDEPAFEAIWQRAVQVVCEEVLPGVTRPEVEHEVLRLIGAQI